MTRTVTIPTTGAVTTDNATPGTPSTTFGDPPQWADNTDATYVLLQGIYQPGLGIPGSGTADLVPDPTVRTRAGTTVTARLRMRSPSGKALPFVAIIEPNGNQLVTGGQSGVSPGATEWVDVPMGATEQNLQTFLYHISTGSELLRLTIAAPVAGFTFPAATTTYQWYIYEAEIVLGIPSVDAPPCRIFPRSDGLGVGAGRAFPPPRSQQRSPGNRGVGYY